MAKLASVLSIRCPACKQAVTAFDEVIFIEGYLVKVTFTHCNRELESSELPILGLFPESEDKKGVH